jgi:hypothetical protein
MSWLQNGCGEVDKIPFSRETSRTSEDLLVGSPQSSRSGP